MRVAVWRSSTTHAKRTGRSPRAPARRAARRSRIGRSRLPPAPAMYAPISWMSVTEESSSRRISVSTASRSSPTSTATRSLSRPSRAGVATRRALLRDHAVLDLYRGAGRNALQLRHREPLADFRDPRGGDFLVEVAQDLAGDRMHDRDAIAPQAEHGAGLHAVGRGEIHRDAARVDEEHEPPSHPPRRSRR